MQNIGRGQISLTDERNNTMRKILIYFKHKGYGLKQQETYNHIFKVVDDYYAGTCPNYGNKLWLQGIMSVLNNGENELTFADSTMTTEYINSEFDYVVLPLANIFSKEYIEGLYYYADIFQNISIPAFVISCGVQADSYDELDTLVTTLREPASAFIKSIYNTGGEFALRGWFTKEFFDKLGFRQAVVTGCTSLYSLPPSKLHINKQSNAEIVPAFNGQMKYVWPLLKHENGGGYLY